MRSQGSTVGGLIGVAAGVAIVALWNLFWWLVKSLLVKIFRTDQPENKSVSTVLEDKDIEAYYRRKKKQK